MLFALWQSKSTVTSEAIWAGVRSKAPSAREIQLAFGRLLVDSPATSRRRGADEVVAGLAHVLPDRPEDAEGPFVRATSDRLELTVGPLPQYPLYYWQATASDLFLVSSRLELLLLGASRAFRPGRVVALATSGADEDTSATILSDIRRVRPSEIITVAGRVDRRRAVPRVHGGYHRASPAELAEAVRMELTGAIKRSIGSAQRVGVFVSGGLDSSSVLALAVAAFRGTPAKHLAALNMYFAGAGDDRAYLDDLCRDLGIVPLRLSPDTDASAWVRRSLCLDVQPTIVSSTCIDAALCARAKQENLDVVLSGFSGDQIMGGLPVAYALLARRGHPIRALRGALRLRAPWTSSRRARVMDLIVRPTLRPLVPAALRRWRRQQAAGDPWLTPEFRRLADHNARSTDHLQTLPDSPNGRLELDCTSSWRADLADLGGQVESATGCAPRDVFLDRRFVEFMVRVDPVQLQHRNVYRGLFRMAMRGVLPDRLRLRTDKGRFETAIARAILRSGELDHLHDLASLRALASMQLVDPSAFRPAFDACAAAIRRGMQTDEDRMTGSWSKVWSLLSIEETLRQLNERARERA